MASGHSIHSNDQTSYLHTKCTGRGQIQTIIKSRCMSQHINWTWFN